MINDKKILEKTARNIDRALDYLEDRDVEFWEPHHFTFLKELWKADKEGKKPEEINEFEELEDDELEDELEALNDI